MKRSLLILLTLTLLGLAADSTAAEIRAEKLADNIWRVRAKRAEAWPESGLNRYGVLANLPVLDSSDSLDGVANGRVVPAFELTEKGFSLRLPLQPGERVYGLGDVSRANVQRRPGHYRMRVENITSYIPMPVFWTTRGWGLFLNSTWTSEFDIGEADPDAVTITAKEGELDFYLFTGATAEDLLAAYTTISGRPKLLPIWGYGFTFVNNQYINERGLVDNALKFRELGIPCDVQGLEPGWMETHYDATTRKHWDLKRFFFPWWAPAGGHTFIGALRRMGVKLSLWLCCNYDLYKYEEDLLAGREKPFAPVKGRALGMGRENPDVNYKDLHITANVASVKTGYAGDPEPYRFEEGERPWFEHLRQFVDQGVVAFKLDGANQVSEWNGKPNRKWSNGMKDEEAHNLYPAIYDKQMSTGFEDYTGRRSMVYSAGGYAGIQQYVATWSGDTGGGEKPLISMLNLGLSAHPHQTVDMSATSYEGVFFGFFTPWAQLNSWDYWFEPWLNPPAFIDHFRRVACRRYRLMPYIYSMAARAHRTGFPICRPLSLAYPECPEYDEVSTSYLFGDSLLITVYADEAVIPPGDWFEFDSGVKVTGPCRVKVLDRAQKGGVIYVKAGAIIPMWPEVKPLEKGWCESVELHVWPGPASAFSLYEDDGTSLGYKTGEFATTRIIQTEGKLDIAPREGSFKGMGPVSFTTVLHEVAQ